MVNDYDLRGAGMWALGYDGGHAELYRAFAESFLVDKTRAPGGHPAARAEPGRRGLRGRLVGARHQQRRRPTTSRHRWRAARGSAWLHRHDRDLRRLAGPRRHRLRVPRPRPRQQGQHRRLERRPRPGTRRRRCAGRVRAGHHRRARLPRRPGHRGGPARVHPRGDDRGDHRRPGQRGRLDLVRGHPADPRVGPGLVRRAGRLDRGAVVDRDPRRGGAGPEQHPGQRRARRASTSRRRRQPAAWRDAPAARSRPTATARDDALRLRWTNTVALDDARSCASCGPTATLVGTLDVAARAAGERAWDWNGRVGGDRVADGRYVLQLVGTARRADVQRALGPADDARPRSTRYAVTVDTVAPSVTSAAATTRLISPNGDGVLDRTRLTLDATGATRWTIRIAGPGGDHRAQHGRQRGFGRARVGRDGRRRPRGSPTGATRPRSRPGTRPATRAAGRSRSPSTRRGPGDHADRARRTLFSPNGDGTADTTPARLDRGRARDGLGAPVPGRHPDPVVGGGPRDQLGRDLERHAAPTAAAGAGRPVHAPGQPPRRRRQHADGLGAGRRRPDGRRARLVAPLLPAGRRRAPRRRDDRVAADPRRDDHAQGLRRGRARSSGPRGPGAPRAPASRSWTWNGRDGDGALVAQGAYVARLTVVSPLGTSVLQRHGLRGGVHRRRSNATRVGPGETLRVRFATVEPLADAADRDLPPARRARPSRVTATRLADGTYRATFRVAAGDPGAAHRPARRDRHRRRDQRHGPSRSR